MDPNETLRRIRELVEQQTTLTPYGRDREEFGPDIARLRERIRQLEAELERMTSSRDLYRGAAHQARAELALLRDSDVDVTYGVRSTLPSNYYDEPDPLGGPHPGVNGHVLPEDDGSGDWKGSPIG